MDQNQTTDNQILDNQPVDNELQKAIDNIANTTNVDPVFSDPVAAPSSVPEGDTGELGEPVGPFPEPKVEVPTPTPEPAAPIDNIEIPDISIPEPPMPEPTIPEPIAPEPITPEPVMSNPLPSLEPTPTIQTGFSSAPAEANLSMHQVKEAALRDLMPLIDHLNMNPSQKFSLYRNIFEDLKDYTVLSSAYNAAKEIPSETERAEALLYLIESIDKM